MNNISSVPAGTGPSIAIDSHDRVTAAWTTARGDRPYDNLGKVQVVRIDANGVPGAVRDLTSPDSSPPDLTIMGTRQPVETYIRVTATCDEWCELYVAPSLQILPKGRGARARRSIDLTDFTTSNVCTDKLGFTSRCSPRLFASLSRPVLKRVTRALERDRKVLATYHVLAVDDGGNSDLATKRVRLGRPEADR